MTTGDQAARYAALYRERERARQAGLRARAAALRDRLPEAARVLREEYGATRVGVFGSLVTGRFDEASDVDLYVDAVARGRYFEAVDRLCRLLGADVDLVELTAAPESLRRRIAEDGVDVG